MKIALVTDTHYGFDHNSHKIHQKLLNELYSICTQENITTVLHTGDWAANKQDQLYRSWKMFREYLPGINIYAVIGNHDYWNAESYSQKKRNGWPAGKPYSEMTKDHYKWSLEHDIHLLEDQSLVRDGVAFFGFNGWYDQLPVNTNDHNFMPRYHEGAPIDQYLRYNSLKQFDKILIDIDEIKEEMPDVKVLLATHFPSYGKQPEWNFMLGNKNWMEFIADKVDVYCVGHSHQSEDFIYKHGNNSVRCINAGSCDIKAKQCRHRYNAPIIKVFEI
jgi:predicted phosphodiesterase